jgi:hypothetical protein
MCRCCVCIVKSNEVQEGVYAYLKVMKYDKVCMHTSGIQVGGDEDSSPGTH